MSLASSPDCLLRPEDKALQYLFPTVAEVNSFDDFFNEELYNCASNNVERVKDEEDETGDLFALNLSDSTESYEQGHGLRQCQKSPAQPWRKGAWSLGRSDSPLHVGKTRKTQDAPITNISPVHLLTNDFALDRFSDTKSPSPDRLQFLHCSDQFEQQRLAMETSLSPSPMYSQHYRGGDKNGFVEAWQQDFDHFNLGFDDDFAQPFPIDGGLYQAQTDVRFGYPTKGYMTRGRNMEGVRAATMHNTSRVGNTKSSVNQSSRDLSAIMNSNHNATVRNKISATPVQNSQNLFSGPTNPEDQAAYRFINEHLQPMSDWTTSESLHSSNSSSNSQISNSSTENHQQALYNTIPPQTWWSPPTTALDSQSIPAIKSERPEIHQPKPRRATHHVLSPGYAIDTNFNHTYPQAEEIGIAIPYQPTHMQHNVAQCTPVKHEKSRSYQMNSLTDYPPLPPPGYAYQDESPFTTPRRRATAPSRSPSPSTSPSRGSRSRTSQQRSPTRRDPSTHRRKSIAKSGPKGAETPRHRSLSRPPRTPKAPRTPGESQGIGFVNFTPKDASKLLNDVAPSGSSKTRARREQEARDRRKKLSEAAINAVRLAGGDVTALERAILS